MSIRVEYFIYGCLYISGLLTVITVAFVMLRGLYKIEKTIVEKTGIPTLEDVEGKWFNTKSLVTILFALFIIYMGDLLNNLIHYFPNPHNLGRAYSYHLAVMFLIIIGVTFVSRGLSLLWLKGFVPQVYKIYKPFYSAVQRNQIEQSKNAIIALGSTR